MLPSTLSLCVINLVKVLVNLSFRNWMELLRPFRQGVRTQTETRVFKEKCERSKGWELTVLQTVIVPGIT